MRSAPRLVLAGLVGVLTLSGCTAVLLRALSAPAVPEGGAERDVREPSIDPRFANPQNEIWIDIVTDEAGAGSAETTVAWEFPADRRAGSVVDHAMPTSAEPGEAGTAGARAACISVGF